MKATFVRLFAAVALLALAVSVQADSRTPLRVTVPFNFVAGGQKLPAGDYSIVQSMDTGVVTVYSLHSKQSVIMISEPASSIVASLDASLKFEKHNGEEYLVGVSTASGAPRLLPLVHSAK